MEEAQMMILIRDRLTIHYKRFLCSEQINSSRRYQKIPFHSSLFLMLLFFLYDAAGYFSLSFLYFILISFISSLRTFNKCINIDKNKRNFINVSTSLFLLFSILKEFLI